MSPPAARTATSLLNQIADAFLRRVTSLTEKQHWFLYAGLGAVLISWVSLLPEYYGLEGLPERMDAKFLAWHAEHPLTPNTEYLTPPPDFFSGDGGIVSHLYKTSFRLTVPLLSRVLPFGIWSWIVLPGLCGLIFYPVLSVVLAQLTGNRTTATLLTWAYATCGATEFFFGRFHTLFGDGVAYLLLAIVALSNRPWVIFASVLLAAFTDERAVVATTILYFLRSLQGHTVANWKLKALWPSNSAMWTMIIACSCYLLLRYGLHVYYGLENDSSGMVMPSLIFHLRHSIPDLLFKAYEGLWALPMLALLSAVAARNFQWALAYVGALAFAFASCFLVFDLERSLGFMFPVLLAAVWALRGEKVSTMHYLFAGIFAVNLFWCDIKESMLLHGPYLLLGRG